MLAEPAAGLLQPRLPDRRGCLTRHRDASSRRASVFLPGSGWDTVATKCPGPTTIRATSRDRAPDPPMLVTELLSTLALRPLVDAALKAIEARAGLPVRDPAHAAFDRLRD